VVFTVPIFTVPIFTVPIFTKLVMLNGITFESYIQNFNKRCEKCCRNSHTPLKRLWLSVSLLSGRFCRRFGRRYKVTDGQSPSLLLQLARKVLSVSAVTSPAAWLLVKLLCEPTVEFAPQTIPLLCLLFTVTSPSHISFSLSHTHTHTHSLSLSLLLLHNFLHRPLYLLTPWSRVLLEKLTSELCR
jgi:hypothetical protein